MRIALIDDQKEEVLHLNDCLSQFAKENQMEFEITAFSNADLFLSEYKHNFDFIIFDIDMPGTNGMDAAKQLRTVDSDVAIMFVTNMPQYALDGYAVEAVDYCVKPIDYPGFCLKMQKVLRFIKRNADHRIQINTVDGILSMQISEIFYIESQLHYLIFHTVQGDFKSRATLNEIEKTLHPYHFSRGSASFLINLKHVSALHGDMVVVNGTQIKLSRGKKQSFLSEFTKYMGGIL